MYIMYIGICIKYIQYLIPHYCLSLNSCFTSSSKRRFRKPFFAPPFLSLSLFHLERTNPVDEAIYAACVAEEDFKRGVAIIHCFFHWIFRGLLHPRVVFPRYSIFISFQFGCFCQTILNVEFTGVEDPLTTENHVLMRNGGQRFNWHCCTHTQAVDENHRKLKVTSILAHHEKRVFFIIPNCQWFGSFLDLPPTQNAIVANKGLGWDFPNSKMLHVILVLTGIQGGGVLGGSSQLVSG